MGYLFLSLFATLWVVSIVGALEDVGSAVADLFHSFPLRIIRSFSPAFLREIVHLSRKHLFSYLSFKDKSGVIHTF